MIGKKKGFSASQSKRMSARMDASMIGTHVTRRPPASRGKHLHKKDTFGASHVEFSNTARSNDVQSGFVQHIGTSSSSGESDSAYSRRVSRVGYVEALQRRKRRKRTISIFVIIAVVLVVSVGVGFAVYKGAADNKLALNTSNASEALTAVQDDQPAYMLMVAQLGNSLGVNDGSTTAYQVVRIDKQSKTLSFVTIPSSTMVTLSDGSGHPLYDAVSFGGDAELVRQVSKLIDVPLNHFVYTDEVGLTGMAELVGGVPVTLTEDFDDPRASTMVLYSGEQTLKGDQVLAYLRSANFAGGYQRVADNHVEFTMSLVNRALTSEGLGFAGLVSDAGNYVSCDLTSSDFMALGDAFRSSDEVTVYSCVIPGYLSDDGSGTYVYSTSSWEDMRTKFKDGIDPLSATADGSDIDTSSVTVEVRNGAQATGAATRMGEILGDAGFAIDGVGNTDDGTVYPETLVIYASDENEAAAQAVVNTAGAGRVVEGGDYYTFDTDVLVIIGKDWMPVS